MTNQKPKTSIIIPVFNEVGNISPLFHKIEEATDAIYYQPLEIIFVDDGSTDPSALFIEDLAKRNKQVRLIQLQQNFGKTAALDAGFQAAQGDYIVTMDADLQDDPSELYQMLRPLEDYDLVCAWRVNRTDNDPLHKTVPSAFFNLIVRTLTGVNLHDFNCGYKAYRRETVKNLKLYGELHRFIPVLVAWQGFSIVEIAVNHNPRYRGHSKFGHTRLIAGLLDFITVLFLTRYLKQPMRLFGLAGVGSFGVGMLINLYLAVLWVLGMVGLAQVGPIGTRPLLAVGVMGVIFGVQLLSIGLVGEMIRYYTFNRHEEYTIKQGCKGDVFSNF